MSSLRMRLALSLLAGLALTWTSIARPTPARAAAETFTDNEVVPINLVQFVPCAAGGAGEEVALSGELHLLFHITVDARGGVHVKTHANPQGVRGIGLTTGDKYQGTGVTQDHINVGADGLPVTYTFVNNFRIIGQGPGNNYLVHQTFHITINEHGEVTAEVDNVRVECK